MTKILQWRFKQFFGHFNVLTVHKCSDTGLFGRLSKPALCSLKFQKQITSKAHLFFRSIENFFENPEMQKEIEKRFFD